MDSNTKAGTLPAKDCSFSPSAIVSCWKSSRSSSNQCISISNGAEIWSEFWVIGSSFPRTSKKLCTVHFRGNSAPNSASSSLPAIYNLLLKNPYVPFDLIVPISHLHNVTAHSTRLTYNLRALCPTQRPPSHQPASPLPSKTSPSAVSTSKLWKSATTSHTSTTRTSN